ncbi:MAG: bifunctional phosphoglucose/phosphomannose isomerase [Solirubrobacteraceae bacterium]
MSERPTLTADVCAETDRTGQFGDVTGLAQQLRDALWRVQTANLQPRDTPGGLVIAGMGGASLGGSLARAALGDGASRPVAVWRDYGLPGWSTPDTTVLCVSYSGETEETLAAYAAAQALGAPRIVLTSGGSLAAQARNDGAGVVSLPGGFRSRATIGYTVVAALEVARLCGAGESFHADVDVAAEHVAALAQAWGPDAPEDSLAKTLARALHRTVPQIAGAGLTAPVAYRWKTQINSNAKTPAFAAELPELDHNELLGWERARGLGPFSAVFLDDSDLHPRLRQRIELTRGLIAGRGNPTFRVETIGETRLGRLMSLVLLGDLVSLYLAVLDGVDPAPVESADSIKAALGAG